MDTLTVGDVARLSGVTVRTLHHYDEVGLLSPSTRTDAGYRLYDDRDIDRLRTILTYRELGLGLDEIAGVLDGDVDATATLHAARDRIRERIVRLEAIASSLDDAIEAMRKGTPMTPEEKLSVFGDFDPAQYEAEVEERWGDTDAYAQSARRTASYTADDWRRLRAEADEINERFLALMREGAEPGSERAREVVEAHRRHIGSWFYDCPPEMHAGLGQMYVSDARFTENIDAAGEGLAAYMAAAIAAAYDEA